MGGILMIAVDIIFILLSLVPFVHLSWLAAIAFRGIAIAFSTIGLSYIAMGIGILLEDSAAINSSAIVALTGIIGLSAAFGIITVTSTAVLTLALIIMTFLDIILVKLWEKFP